MTILPDQDERNRALTDHASTLLIEAGAGSGKTSLMAGRIALMLARGITPQNIAAITFTELASGQLFEKISEEVNELLAGRVPQVLDDVIPKGLNDTERASLEKAHAGLGELTVTTIHGFCQQLIRPYPVEAKRDPGARVMDATEASLVWQELLQAFLRDRLDEAHENSALGAFVQIAGDKAETEINRLADALRKNRTAVVAESDVTPDQLETLRQAIEEFVGWLRGVGFEEETTNQLAEELVELTEAYPRSLSPETDATTIIRLAINPPTCPAHTQKLGWRNWGKKGKWKDAAAEHGKSKAEGGRISDEGDKLYQDVGQAWKQLQGRLGATAFRLLASEFDELLERYTNYKRETALQDFDDLLLNARDLLRENNDVRQALANRYQHVLVDEFQDTDPVQAEILWRLCAESETDDDWRAARLRPGALFCVGDPKQAIYRFRGADVDTYVAARETIEAQFPGNVLQIYTNFRSFEPILTWVNQRFAGPLSAPDQPGFQELTASRPTVDGLPTVARLEIELVGDGQEPTQNEEREAEASAVAKLCQRLIGSHQLYNQKRKHDPCARPGDIALLAPVGTELWRYERALEQSGIAVASQAGKGFFRRQEIQDLIAVTRTLADTRDTVAFGALLRGPLVGLSEEELLDIVDGLPRGDAQSGPPRLRLWTPATEIAHPLAREVLETLQDLARKAKRLTPFEVLAEAVEALRVRAILRQRHPGGAERALANVDRYLEISRPYDSRGLGAFAAEMRARWENTEAEVEGRADAEEQAVHLITKHSAKGLEWPIVIPINMMTKLQSSSGPLLERSTGMLHYNLGPVSDAAYEEVLNQERAQQQRERVRLLYVACTRASELLVLPHVSRPKGPVGWLRLVDLEVSELPLIDVNEVGSLMPQPHTEKVNEQERDAFASETGRIVEITRSIDWHRPSRHEPREEDGAIEKATSVVFVENEDVSASVLGGPVRGSILHKLMEEVLLGDLTEDTTELARRAAELITQLGKASVADPGKGLSPDELASTILATLALPEVAERRDRLQPEFSIFAHSAEGSLKERLIATSGVADAVAFSSHGNIEIVVDWKSDVNPSQALREKYQSQLEDYKEASGASSGMIVYMTLRQIDKL